MPETPRIYPLAGLPTERPSRTYSRAAIRGETCTVGLNWFEPGNPDWELHSHPFDQVSFVLSGTMAFSFDGTLQTVAAPSVVWIPPGLPHWANIRGDDPCFNLDVFGLVRDDFKYLLTYQEWLR